ncbi:HTTM domain-containing protein [Streptomyces spinosirectus]|uniref:HTTM domain-containing protein n=1 Tax=Streptomyces TaxID=1883 RepID=UPI000D36061C|nr:MULTISPECIES: HTTM domain-containing protein [Streptomyces]MBY8345860.1 HTTM domain-containing protein [Streptomyces plumbidurans]PTM95658.1 vitamin K-dependent gamma-carboxylase-like protein [Streptomyces sp. VMFN-G11Ma]UIR19257.1 HTTM domain-containing protein [Streptomyces spinosirectus]
MNRLALSVSSAIARVTESALGPYQTAVIRLGFSATWLLFLLREFPHREELYGPGGPWSWDLAQQLIAVNHAFTALMWSDSGGWFEFVYVLSVLTGALLLLGWRTRTMSVLFMIGVLSLQNRSVFVGDGGDNVLHLMSVYLVFTRCGQVWSLDARRARREGAERARGERVTDRVGVVLWAVFGAALVAVTAGGRFDGTDATVPVIVWLVWLALAVWWVVGRRAKSAEPRILLDVVGNIVHNGALFVIMAEACLIYATAGWYKIQGSRWQDGTAVYYPLHLDYFSPWPGLADLLSSSGTMVMLVTYGTVVVQVAFPFTLFNRRVKNVLLAAMMTEHAVIAVVLGLPFFSLAMIAADSVFLPTSFLHRLGGWAARARARVVARARRTPLPGPRAPENPEPTHADSPA